MSQSDKFSADQLHAYIMCGGGGTRLWPLSRADNPKQNLTLIGTSTMLEQTAARTSQLTLQGIDVAVNLMGGQSQIPEMTGVMQRLALKKGWLISEPSGKNTAPAVATASLVSAARGEAVGHDPLVLMLPSDHIINPVEKLITAIGHGVEAANNGKSSCLVLNRQHRPPAMAISKLMVIVRSHQSSPFAKNLIWRPQKPIRHPAVTCGMPASFCFELPR